MLKSLEKIKKDRKKVGRGGDLGGTCGKGHKGQKARSGGFVKAQFEGGQTPLTRRLPKRGFNNYNFETKYKIISIGQIDLMAKNNNIVDFNKDIFVENKIIKNKQEKVKILANGIITSKVNVSVDSCSEKARLAIEALGGTIKLISL
jgi:large subunit ribosomal protein L15